MVFPKRVPISALPVPPPTQLLIHNLTQDPLTPSLSVFRTQVLTDTPSVQRRSRLLAPQAHFAFVTPMPLPFPYNIRTPPGTLDKVAYIENWFSEREAKHERAQSLDDISSSLRLYDRHNVDQPHELLGVSKHTLRDCFPHLDIGDAFATLGAPSLTAEFAEEGGPEISVDERAVSARQEFLDVMSGHSVLMTPPETDDSAAFAPWSLRYSGHQFGVWAGQLGDGRAISILASPHPSNPDLTYEMQLKGAGRTPFARMADGLAVLRSSIREYLCSEAMHALSIPTTRALSIVSLPALSVARERMETASVVTRVAPSFIRIGCFEALNGPSNLFFFGGGQQHADLDGLRILGEYVAHKVLRLELEEGEAWGSKLVLEIARRNAKMVAAWQVYGFMHGVINTDNVSVLGLTIDYGPYAFMDVFDPLHICNHSDESGRYAYKYQPDMILYAVRALLDALAPLIGAEFELGGKAVSSGWAADASKEKIDAWKKEGIKLKDELDRLTQQITSHEYATLMRKRLALRRPDLTDESRLFKPLLDVMAAYKLDFHGTFRTLVGFRPRLMSAPSVVDGNRSDINAKEQGNNEESLQRLVTKLLAMTPEPAGLDHARATREWMGWLERYAERIESERGDWDRDDDGDFDEKRERAAWNANPRFVLRQWVLEDVIKRVERDSESGKRVLGKVLQMACNPFDPWGAEGDPRSESELTAEEREERRYCGMGSKQMLGFQCSCSS